MAQPICIEQSQNTRSNCANTTFVREDGKKIESVHFIGIGGTGMSGIARVAHDQGLQVSGSDLRQSKYTDQLKACGIAVSIGHSEKNVAYQPDVVVVSTAILNNNPEYCEAKRLGLTIWHRAKMLSFLGRNLQTLAVAGTHGKTTSSSMLASVLDAQGASPTFLIGGIVRAYNSNAHSGTGSFYVVEADESDKSFTYLNPASVLITNIEADHLDHYKDVSEIRAKFAEFIASVPENGTVVVCGDDPTLVSLARESTAKSGAHVITYGFTRSCDARITTYEAKGTGSTFTLELPENRVVEGSILQNPGKHNALNGAGVLVLCDALGYDIGACAHSLAQFRGVARRFDVVGSEAGVTVVDDYAHHPTEIAATIQAAAELDFKRVVVLFQPHRYSRAPLFTEVLKDEFACAFDLCDELVFMDVYSAGETPVPGINGKTFLNVVLGHAGHPNACYVARRVDVASHVASLCKPGDLVLTMGAGDVTALGPQILEELRAQER